MVKTVASEVLSIWQRADIDTVRIDIIEEKIHTLFGELDKLLKHWDRLKPDKDPLMSFKADIEKLFDVSPANLLERLKSSRKPEWEEDWLWYQGMCKVPQVGCMTTRDASLASRKQRRDERQASAQARAECEATVVAERFKTVSPLASASSATGTPGTLAMSNSEGAESGHVRAAGGDLDDFTASHSTVKRHRKLEQANQASHSNH